MKYVRKKTGSPKCLGAIGAVFLGGMAHAQAPSGLGYQADGLILYQGSAGLDNGGSFSASRAFLRGSSLYRFGNGHSIGLSVSYGQFSYDFDQVATAPWDDIRDVRISVPMRFQLGNRSSMFLSPQLRWDYERGASISDGKTYGIFAGVAWEVTESLTIGPAFGAYSQLGDDTEFFPALLIDWKMTDKLSLGTGTGPGATRGPGLTLSYSHSDVLDFALSARSEEIRFRLDDSGPAPGGVGEDKSIPVAFSVSYRPNPAMLFSAFVGAELNGQLTLENANGVEVSRQTYDTAPIAGLSFRIRF